MDPLISLLILVLVLAVVVMVAFWLIDLLGAPGPFPRIAKVIIALIAVIVLIRQALPLLG